MKNLRLWTTITMLILLTDIGSGSRSGRNNSIGKSKRKNPLPRIKKVQQSLVLFKQPEFPDNGITDSPDSGYGRFLCGGVLISRNHVLTTSGCARSTKRDRLEPRFLGLNKNASQKGIISEIELNEQANLAIIRLEPKKTGSRSQLSSLPVETILEVNAAAARFYSLGLENDERTMDLVNCSNVRTCTLSFPPAQNQNLIPVKGWPILAASPRPRRQRVVVVGLMDSILDNQELLNNSTKTMDDDAISNAIFDKPTINWIARTVASSIRSHLELPTCRGQDRETLNLLLNAAATNPLGASTSTNLKLESTSAGFDGEEGEKMRPEVMLADSSSDSSRIVIEQLRKDLNKARSHLENQTRTIDRLQSKLDLRDRDIVDLKRAIQSGCESHLPRSSVIDCRTGPKGPSGLKGKEGPVGPRGPEGRKGAKGPPGERGERGFPGRMGNTGPAGVGGMNGEDGNPGARGDKGEIGPKGLPGLAGPQGQAGRNGKKGDRGDGGPRGSQGPIGNPGSEGPRGQKGEVGKTGVPGPEGPQGKHGDPGFHGKPGSSGSPGRPGLPGVPGPKGESGRPGTAGAVGSRGESGPPGPKGISGLPGMTGYPGDQGPPGLEGDRGIPGDDGPTGPAGDVGPMGPRGMPGNRGPRGRRGRNGQSGIPGNPGYPGPAGPVGPMGMKGDMGVPGDQGEPGVEGVPGLRGAPGPAGEVGIPGSPGGVGRQGKAGTPGDKGYAGRRGRRGGHGDRGSIGLRGPPGEPGESGDNGPKGPPGLPGLKGDSGKTGPPGIKGNPGNEGQQGPPGIPGMKGVAGVAGTKGELGPPGDPGVCPPRKQRLLKDDPGSLLSDLSKMSACDLEMTNIIRDLLVINDKLNYLMNRRV